MDRNDKAIDRESLGCEVFGGATGCGVVGELVRDFDACFQTEMLGANRATFELISVHRQGGPLTAILPHQGYHREHGIDS